MEKINDKMLTNAALTFVLAIVVAMLVQGWMAPNYAASNQEVKQQMMDESILILPARLKQMQQDGSLNRYTFVDLGETPSLKISNAGSILHIPYKMLLEKKNLKQLKKAEKIILFGSEESQAMMAGQLLVAMGIRQIEVASNNIAFNDEWVNGKFDPQKAELNNEKARFDFSRYFKGAAGSAKSTPSPAGIPQGVKVVKASGGC